MDKILETIETDYKGRAYCDIKMECMYLTSEGRKCAIGLFVDNKKARRFLGAVSELIETHSVDCIDLLPTKYINKLQIFQNVHDDYNYGEYSILSTEESFESLTVDEQKMMLQFSALYLFEDEL